jgi:CheY-like chemotaxis protein
LEVVCELSDGLAAVQKAEELKPDLILLDIGLPTLNGIEAARQIRKLVPKAKILFLSQESSADIVKEVLNLGARGYVVKTQAGSELLAAVEAVLRGKQFVSKGLAGQKFADAADTHAPDWPSPEEVLASHTPSGAQRTEIPGYHDVLFYSDDAVFLENSGRFIEAALEAGNAAIVVATESHRVSLRKILQAHGVDVAIAVEEGRYIPLSVAETLSAFMVDGMPDPVRFAKVASDLISRAAKTVNGKHRRVSACGECAPSLWAKGMAEAAIRTEQLWDDVARTHGVDILCAYPVHSFHADENSKTFQRICAVHSTVYQDGNAS